MRLCCHQEAGDDDASTAAPLYATIRSEVRTLIRHLAHLRTRRIWFTIRRVKKTVSRIVPQPGQPMPRREASAAGDGGFMGQLVVSRNCTAHVPRLAGPEVEREKMAG